MVNAQLLRLPARLNRRTRERKMIPQAKQVLDELKANLRKACLAEVGGFRPPENPKTSWFGKGVCLENEGLPVYKGKQLFPLLQINVTELPLVPNELSDTNLLVVFFDKEELPFNQNHGEGWLIREYQTLEGLVPLPETDLTDVVRPFPIRWHLVEDDAPGWETADSLVGISLINDDEEAERSFFEDFKRYNCTKVGGFPDEVQNEPELENYVFQIGTEEKAGWTWVDNGTAYFYKNAAGEWSWDCQFL